MSSSSIADLRRRLDAQELNPKILVVQQGDERRTAALARIELREQAPGATRTMPTLIGYAATFGDMSEPIMDQRRGSFLEEIDPHAFDRTLSDGHPIYALVNHNPSQIIGSTRNGSLALSVTDHGLRAEIRPPDTVYGQGIVDAIRQQTSRGMSFSFDARRETWSVRSVGGKMWNVRTLLDVDLYEVSALTVEPAYPSTTLAIEGRGGGGLSIEMARQRMRQRDMELRHRLQWTQMEAAGYLDAPAPPPVPCGLPIRTTPRPRARAKAKVTHR